MDDYARYQKIVSLIGEITLHWSEVEELWYLLFTIFMPSTPREQVDAVFSLFDTGKRQRDLVRTVAAALYKPDSCNRPHKIMKQIGRLMSKTETVSPKRNAAIHAKFMILPGKDGASLHYRMRSGMPGKKNFLEGRDLVPALEEILEEIKGLIQDLENFRVAMLPKQEVPPELLEALHKLGLRIPGTMISRQTPQDDPSEP